MAEPIKVHLCDHCNRVVAEVIEGKLIIRRRHSVHRKSEEHVTTIDLTDYNKTSDN